MDDETMERAKAMAAQRRTEIGRKRYREVMVSDAPAPMTPYLEHGVVNRALVVICSPRDCGI